MPQFVVVYDAKKRQASPSSATKPTRRISRVTADDMNAAEDMIRDRAKREKWRSIKIISSKRAMVQDNDPRKGTF